MKISILNVYQKYPKHISNQNIKPKLKYIKMQWNFSELSTTGRNILTQRLTPEMRVNGESGTPWSSCSGNFTGVKPLLSNCTGVNPRSSIFTGVNPLLSNCIWNRQVQKDVYLKMDIFEPVMVDYIAVWPLPIHFFSIQNFF